MKTLKLFVFLLPLAWLACSHGNTDRGPLAEIRIDPSQVEDAYDLAPDVEPEFDVLALETDDQCLIGTIQKLVFANGMYYILDRQGAAIYLFGTDGKLVKKLDKKGRGPGEYLGIQSFGVIGGNIWIYEGAFGGIKCYDKDLNMIAAAPFQITALEMGVLGENLLLTTNGIMQAEGKDYQLFQYDTQNGRTESFLPFEPIDMAKFGAQMKTAQLAPLRDSCLLIYSYCDTVFQIGQHAAVPRYRLVFTERYDDSPQPLSQPTSPANIIQGINSIAQTDKSIVFEFSDQNSLYCSVYNKQNGNCTTHKNLFVDSSLGSKVGSYFIQDNQIIAYYPAGAALNKHVIDPEKIENPQARQKIESVLSKLKPDDNPVIIRLKLKKDSKL